MYIMSCWCADKSIHAAFEIVVGESVHNAIFVGWH